MNYIGVSDLYSASDYASDAVTALAVALHNCLNSDGSGMDDTDCDGSSLDWQSIGFPGITVLTYNNSALWNTHYVSCRGGSNLTPAMEID